MLPAVAGAVSAYTMRDGAGLMKPAFFAGEQAGSDNHANAFQRLSLIFLGFFRKKKPSIFSGISIVAQGKTDKNKAFLGKNGQAGGPKRKKK